jgi:hypothetical protein
MIQDPLDKIKIMDMAIALVLDKKAELEARNNVLERKVQLSELKCELLNKNRNENSNATINIAANTGEAASIGEATVHHMISPSSLGSVAIDDDAKAGDCIPYVNANEVSAAAPVLVFDLDEV